MEQHIFPEGKDAKGHFKLGRRRLVRHIMVEGVRLSRAFSTSRRCWSLTDLKYFREMDCKGDAARKLKPRARVKKKQSHAAETGGLLTTQSHASASVENKEALELQRNTGVIHSKQLSGLPMKRQK
ncbi:MAG: hypothetical protein ABS69_00800 [Nitrosomonadales bacterium SCN 54-20]|nr:MAG: hypothetical protein ABS69_00800 [Nitrosomonadales bacterium SCN 54-20]